MTPAEEISALKAENAALREQVTALVERVQDLEARLAKDSHDSSKPPSSNGLKRQLPRTRAQRQVQSWLDPWRTLQRCWQAGPHAPPLPTLQVPLDAVTSGQPLYLYLRL